MRLKTVNTILILFLSLIIKGQTISGYVYDENKEILPGASIIIDNKENGISSNNQGFYEIGLKPNRSIKIKITFIGFETEEIRIPMLKVNQNYQLDVILFPKNNIINDVIVRDKDSRKQAFSRIKAKQVILVPVGNNGVESILKTLPGVSSANELSSQYSVRGGNFDENLVYVNGIEIYRPFLINAGEKEGLSFINPDLVSDIQFSAGGFEAKYGDKMSSVLSIKYKIPSEIKASMRLSFLGGSSHFEGTTKNKKLSYILGLRRKSNQYLLNAMDTKGEYRPSFSDIQTFIEYQFNNKISFNFLGNVSQNQYKMIPQNRDTEFGTLNNALKLRIFFEGQENNIYSTYFGAFQTKIRSNENANLIFTSSIFKTIESENYDILGEYWLYQLENNLGSDEFGEVKFDRGVGKFIDHARNKIEATVLNLSHTGNIFKNNDRKIEWGISYQKEFITDQIKEWTLIDSAGFLLPHPPDNIGDSLLFTPELEMSSFIKSNLSLESNRYTSFFQFSQDIGNFTINSGMRAAYWDLNKEILLSPRLNISYIPLWEKDIIFRAATGIYYQSPFYKELRNLSGEINYSVKSQKSIHYILGKDYLFYSWGRPFKFISEIYYKDLKNLIPYKIDNVRIQYLNNEVSNGYAAGIDLKINGEFVPGVESWASISIMKTQEDIENDYYINNEGNAINPGFIPRPTDQRLNFSLFFQDYIPKNPFYKIHLNMIYGTGLPFGPPNAEKYQDILRIPNYRRVDIGFSSIIKKENHKNRIKWLNKFESIIISAEIFNLLNIDNTVSYIWVSDVNGRQYAVPNYLTSRQLNFKLSIEL
ncbi:MAG: TonB-dependent receptor [Flavobacteriales bacterium]|nr:TonB-dependent receptor [Flavobacteriales bacterium]